MSARCCACGAAGLAPHLAVAGEAGGQGLIPTTDSFGTALADIVRCAVCGHMQLAAMPSEESLAEAYGEAESADYVAEEEGQRATARAVLSRLGPLGAAPDGASPRKGSSRATSRAATRGSGWDYRSSTRAWPRRSSTPVPSPRS